MRSAEAELCCGRKFSSSLHPRMGARSFCLSDQDEEKKRGSLLRGRHIHHGRILLLPYLGCCNRTRCIVVGIVRSDLRCNREGYQKPTEHRTQ